MSKKRWIAFFYCLVVFLSGCGGLSQGPIAELEYKEYDFGVIPTDGVSEANIKIYNRGDTTLKIKDVVTSCSCTTGEAIDKSIAPGESGELIIRVDPNKMSGATTRMPLGIKTNDPNQEMSSVTVSARLEFPIRFLTGVESVSDIEIIPRFFARMNAVIGPITVPQGEATEILIRARQHKNKYVDLLEMKDLYKGIEGGRIHIAADIESSPPELWVDPSIKEFDIKFTVVAHAPLGEYPVYLELKTNIRRYRIMNLTLIVNVVESENYVHSDSSFTVDEMRIQEEEVLDVDVHLVSVFKESNESNAARIAIGESERWYNKGAEIEGYVLEEIYMVQKSVVILELGTGRRLRVTNLDEGTSKVTLIQ